MGNAQEKIGRTHHAKRQSKHGPAMTDPRVCKHTARELTQPYGQLLRRSQRADFNVGQIQSRFKRGQNDRIELLKPVDDEMTTRKNTQEPGSLSSQFVQGCQKVFHWLALERTLAGPGRCEFGAAASG